MSKEDSTNKTLETVEKINQDLDKVVSNTGTLKGQINEISDQYNKEVAICATCDYAKPYGYVDDSAACVSDTRVECERFKDKKGDPLVIGKCSVGCFAHRPKKSV